MLSRGKQAEGGSWLAAVIHTPWDLTLWDLSGDNGSRFLLLWPIFWPFDHSKFPGGSCVSLSPGGGKKARGKKTGQNDAHF